MSTTSSTLIVPIISLLLVGVLSSVIIGQCHQLKVEESQNKVIVHDTIEKARYVYDTLPGTIITPTHVIIYDTIENIRDGMLDSIIEAYEHDTLKVFIHDTLITQYTPLFLKLFPKAPKLIDSRFSKDSIRFDVLDDNGQLHTKIYNPDFNNFTYEFLNGELRSTPVPGVPFLSSLPKLFTTEGYIASTFNPLARTAMLRVDYSLMYKGWIGGTVYGQLRTNVPFGDAGIGLRVKFK